MRDGEGSLAMLRGAEGSFSMEVFRRDAFDSLRKALAVGGRDH